MHRSTLMTCVSGRASATHVFPSFHVQLIKLTQKLLQLVSAGSASIFSDAQPSRQDNEYDDFYATQRYFTSNIEPFVSSFIGAKAYNQSALAHLHCSSRSTHGSVGENCKYVFRSAQHQLTFSTFMLLIAQPCMCQRISSPTVATQFVLNALPNALNLTASLYVICAQCLSLSVRC
ncbi:hypothetical protein AAZV13_19G214500 [Glycine max]